QRYYRWQRDRNDQKMAKQHEAAIAQAHLEAQAQARPVEPTPPVVKEEPTAAVKPDEEDSSSPRRVQTERVNRVFRLPNVNLLKSQGFTSANTNNISYANENAKKLLQILETFSIKATLSEIHVGPAVTKYELKPELGVKVNRIAALQNDIKMALAAKDIRIEAPIPGKSAVGIEIPNPEKTMVFMKDLLKQVPPKYNDSKLFFALGKNLLGDNIYGELNKMPHLLIAGATGSGKSVCVNAIITSILMRAKPEEVQMLLIDPKKVEFTPYKDIPHLIGPVITDPKDASNALKVIVAMMDERYDVFAKVGVRNLDAYKALLASGEDQLPAMPQIVVIVDELADLMLVASKEVEASIQRITQLARAAGIHLIVATQRPSVDVITGVIKANIPSRIAFAVSSAVDSRTILDQVGAEKLLGFGDMLYLPIGENVVQRVQGVYVSDAEVQAVCDWVKQQGSPKYHDAFAMLEMHGSSTAGSAAVMSQSDVLYDEVKRYVVESQKASTSLIQRRFAIGYARAARLMDLLEQNGVIGPSRGSKPREVYVSVNE
ncbi:MAG: DNA translocase FtsK, partial [Erysipelotrichaceae bacterium]